MEATRPTFGFIGIGLGSIALMLALVHFWAGPFSPQPKVEQTVAEKAVAIRDATIAALKGESAPSPQTAAPGYDLDRIASIVTAVLGGLALILAVVGIALKEPMRVAGGAAFLGAGAIAFQFAVVAIGLIVLAVLVSSVVDSLDFG